MGLLSVFVFPHKQANFRDGSDTSRINPARKRIRRLSREVYAKRICHLGLSLCVNQKMPLLSPSGWLVALLLLRDNTSFP